MRNANAFTNPVFSPDPLLLANDNVPPRQHNASNAQPSQHQRAQSGKRIRFNVSNNSNGPQASNKSGTINLSIPFPAKFNPDKDNWLLWKSSVEMFIDRIGIDRSILEEQHCELFTPEEHSTVLGILTQIAPETDGLWFTKLGLQWSYQAWDELSRSYGQRAAIAVQQKLLDFDNTSQRPDETIKNWVVRLRREVKEICLMGSELVPSNTHKIKLLRIFPTPGNELLFRNLLASIRTRLHLLTVQQLEEELINFEEGLTAEQQTVQVNQVMHVGSKMQQSNKQSRPRATYDHKAEWRWRPMRIPSSVSQKLWDTERRQITLDDVCRICFQAEKTFRGCMHATQACDERGSPFGAQVLDHLKKNPHLDHETPQKRGVNPGA